MKTNPINNQITNHIPASGPIPSRNASEQLSGRQVTVQSNTSFQKICNFILDLFKSISSNIYQTRAVQNNESRETTPLYIRSYHDKAEERIKKIMQTYIKQPR